MARVRPVGLAIALLVAASWIIWQGSAAVVQRSTYQHDKCTRLRVEFFERCAASESRHRCEEIWAQLGGKVFDVNPVLSIAEQVNCSEEFE